MIPFEDLGCTDELKNEFLSFCKSRFEQLHLGRVVSLDRTFPLVNTHKEELRAELCAAIKKSAEPIVAVGDWVALEQPKEHEKAIIRAVLARHNEITRIKRVGREGQEQRQVLASNVNTVFVCVNSKAKRQELRRVVRQIAAVYGCSAKPVVLLMKADLASEKAIEAVRNELSEIFPEVKILAVSDKDLASTEHVRACCLHKTTSLLLGESGVGKSTLANALVGKEEMQTAHVRERDNKGRHTTVSRRMLRIPGGGLLIDAPGLRTMQILDLNHTLTAAFNDISEAAQRCKYSNCTHMHEPGCAVKESVSPARLKAYHMLSGPMC